MGCLAGNDNPRDDHGTQECPRVDMAGFVVEVSRQQADDRKQGDKLVTQNGQERFTRNRQCAAREQGNILDHQQANIPDNHQGHIDDHALPHSDGFSVSFATAELPVQDHSQDQAVEEKGNEVGEEDLESQGGHLFHRKDKEAEIHIEEPARKTKEEISGYGDGARKQERTTNLAPLQATLPGEPIVQGSRPGLTIVSIVPDQEEDQADHRIQDSPNHNSGSHGLREQSADFGNQINPI